MSIFKIKLKTNNGNDVKKKETFTVFFRLNYKRNSLTKKVTAEYTYRIMYSKGVEDPKRVLELKNADTVISLEDLTLKVMLNFCHIIGNLSKSLNIDPDFVLFMSPDLEGTKNKSWQFLRDTFQNKKVEKNKKGKILSVEDYMTDKEYDQKWDFAECNKHKIKKAELDILKAFAEINPNTTFMTIDPNRDKTKYAKSINICSQLQDRIDRQVTLDI